MKVSILFRAGLLSLVFTFASCQKSNTFSKTENLSQSKHAVIYGEDNRLDLMQVENPRMSEAARSTVALIESYDISESKTEGFSQLSGAPLGEQRSFCEGEPFGEQPSVANCSGFLVADDIIVTAGHCVRSQFSCETTKFVFDFAINEEGKDPSLVKNENIFSCKKLIHSEVRNNAADFAVIRLDRKVEGREPLNYRMEGDPRKRHTVYVIGHPSGLPTKVTTSGRIRYINGEYFVTNLDTYGGNSGSAVLNEKNHLIEGILVRGERDYQRNGSCYTSKHCAEDNCRGEDVTKIDQAVPYIQAALHPNLPLPGEEIIFDWINDSSVNIPDMNRTGIMTTMEVPEAFDPATQEIFVDLKIEHAFMGDLIIALYAPNGQHVILRNRQNSKNSLEGLAGRDFSLYRSLNFEAQQAGEWRLRVVDRSKGSTGSLNEWSMKFINKQ